MESTLVREPSCFAMNKTQPLGWDSKTGADSMVPTVLPGRFCSEAQLAGELPSCPTLLLHGVPGLPAVRGESFV